MYKEKILHLLKQHDFTKKKQFYLRFNSVIKLIQ